jgi:transposase-like protein
VINRKLEAESKEEAESKLEVCSNPACHDYGKMGVGNIVKYGHDRNGRQRFKCKTCDSVFVETKNTIFYNRKLPKDRIISICKLLAEKNEVETIKRMTRIHKNTITSIIDDLEIHSREMTDFLIKNVGLTELQVKEMWSFVEKQKKIDRKDKLTKPKRGPT